MNRTKRPKCLTDKAKKKKAGETNFRVNNQVRVDNLAKHKAKRRTKALGAPEPPPFSSITVAGLKKFLIEKGIKAPRRAKKVDLVILAEGAK